MNIFPVIIGVSGILTTKEYRIIAAIAPPMMTTSSVRRAAFTPDPLLPLVCDNDIDLSTAGEDNDNPERDGDDRDEKITGCHRPPDHCGNHTGRDESAGKIGKAFHDNQPERVNLCEQ